MMGRWWAGLMVACAASGLEAAPTQRFIVELKSGRATAMTAGVDRLITLSGARAARPLTHVFSGFVAELDEEGVKTLRNHPDVKTVLADTAADSRSTESNTVDAPGAGGTSTPAASVTPAERSTSAFGGLDRIDQRELPLDGGYAYSRAGLGVRIYIAETGIRATHEEFSGRVDPGFSVRADGSPHTDCNRSLSRGTYAAGLAAGSTLGLAKQARIVPIQVHCGVGSVSDHLLAIDWVLGNAIRPAVYVGSVPGEGVSGIIAPALDRLVDAGIPVVVSASSMLERDAATGMLKMNCKAAASGKALVVAGVSETDEVGAADHQQCVTLFASQQNLSAGHRADNDQRRINFSHGAPWMVAGLVALLLEQDASLTPAQIRHILEHDSTRGVLRPNPIDHFERSGAPNLMAYSRIRVEPVATAVMAIRTRTSGQTLALEQAPEPGGRTRLKVGGAVTIGVPSVADCVSGGPNCSSAGSLVKVTPNQSSPDRWTATVEVFVRNTSDERTVPQSTRVVGRFSNGKQVSCQVGPGSSCTLSSSFSKLEHRQTTFSVERLEGPRTRHHSEADQIKSVVISAPI